MILQVKRLKLLFQNWPQKQNFEKWGSPWYKLVVYIYMDFSLFIIPLQGHAKARYVQNLLIVQFTGGVFANSIRNGKFNRFGRLHFGLGWRKKSWTKIFWWVELSNGILKYRGWHWNNLSCPSPFTSFLKGDNHSHLQKTILK